ncbi:MAG: hypothetical protein LBP42_05100 [Treponema sp.]|nr:hypothetical protein [Treponema sp.]
MCQKPPRALVGRISTIGAKFVKDFFAAGVFSFVVELEKQNRWLHIIELPDMIVKTDRTVLINMAHRGFSRIPHEPANLRPGGNIAENAGNTS